MLICAPSDPLARARAVAIEELAGRPWLLREPGSGTRTMCEEYLAAHAVAPRTLTLGSNGAIKQAAALGLGVALQSRWSVQVEVEMGMLAVIRVRGGLPRRSWYVVRSAVGPVRAAVEEFLAFVRTDEAKAAVERGQSAADVRAAT